MALLFGGSAYAQNEEGPSQGTFERLPALHAPADLGTISGRPIARIEVVTVGTRWVEKPSLRRVRLGDPLSPKVARRAIQELLDTGRFASVRAEAEAYGTAGALLRLVVVPRRIIGSLKIVGTVLDEQETLRALGVDVGDEVTTQTLNELGDRARRYHATHGYPSATVRVSAIDTDDPSRVLVLLEVTPGPARVVNDRIFSVAPAPSEALMEVLDGYGIAPGDRADEDAFQQADSDLQNGLRASGWHRATVTHRLTTGRGGTTLVVIVESGPLLRPRFEGNRSFDGDDLTDVLELETSDDRSFEALIDRVRRFYVERGFLDVDVSAEERGAPSDPIHEIVIRIVEHERVRVVGREYPCLTGKRTAADAGDEIDGVLSDSLPGTGVFGAVDATAVNSAIGPTSKTGARVPPLQLNPWNTYVPEVYDKALHRLQELYRSEGYLAATVGPAVALRRQCDPRSPPGRCIPMGPRLRPPTLCPANEKELPVEDPPAPVASACVPDPAKGIHCEPDVVLQIPIKLGPRALLWDVAFEGNDVLVENHLAEVAGLHLGGPVSQVELEKARIRLLDEYAEEGFAFASVELALDLSPDRTRARARYIISERERVRVRDIVVHGARRTNESLILRRVALEKGELYRRSLIRDTEERLATLGIFSTITVTLEDPDVPARDKVVIVTVVERPPQYLDVKPGFSTGDGIRITFEYGHRNIAGEAIQFVLRVQLGYLPSALILERDVRRKFDNLSVGERLERRNSASIEFPEIGLGPLFRFGVDGVDVRDNARDFGLTKDAGIVTLSYRPTTRFTAQLGGSLERNDANIFDEEGANAPSILRVPEGITVAVAERTAITWDRRDNPFGATSGTFVSGGVEHVRAYPVGGGAYVQSEFLRYTNRLAGYLRLNEAGLSLALSFGWGLNQQIRTGSRTYPDRLFFFGGVDSIRGFLQDSVIPQDVAERIQGTADLPDTNPTKVTVKSVVIRGGDFMMNPRAELRVPLGGIWQTALFLDSGNLWVEPDNIEPTKLRYAAGSGLRATTPIGPLAFDLGFNLDRRDWEDPFAFHFSIGLF